MATNPLATLARAYDKAREIRLKKAKEVEALAETEKAHKEALMSALRARKGETGAVVDGYLYALVTKQEPSVEDWVKLYNFIKKTDGFDLLHRRVNNAAVKVRWEQNVKVPGVAAFPVESLSVTKSKE